jgi:hypothetical protein
MSTTVTLEELESERADLLPSRETLCGCRPSCCGGFDLSIVVCVNLCI